MMVAANEWVASVTTGFFHGGSSGPVPASSLGAGALPTLWSPGGGVHPTDWKAVPDMPDAKFGDPRLAPLYDLFEGDRSDLAAYVSMAAEFRARRVLDVGCGPGRHSRALGEQGIEVVGIDISQRFVDLAREGAPPALVPERLC